MSEKDLLGGELLRAGGMGSHHSAKALKEEWLTPPTVLASLGAFDLDPCAPAKRPWDIAAKHYTIFENGLVQPWQGRVFLNPPYGRETGKWLARLADHGDGIALVFARVETEDWFEGIWTKATAALFLKGRLTFYNSTGSPALANGGAPSALLAYGATNAFALRNCGLHGAYVDLAKVHIQ